MLTVHAGRSEGMAGSFGAGLLFRFSTTVLEMCLYLAGDWPARLVASIIILGLGMSLIDVPEWTICGRGGE